MTSIAGLSFAPPAPSTVANNPREAMILIGAIFLAAMAATAWIMVARQLRLIRRRRRRRHHVFDRVGPAQGGDSESDRTHATIDARGQRGGRYTRRNPTLAETGGLPPRRSLPDGLPAQTRPSPPQPDLRRNQ